MMRQQGSEQQQEPATVFDLLPPWFFNSIAKAMVVVPITMTSSHQTKEQQLQNLVNTAAAFGELWILAHCVEVLSCKCTTSTIANAARYDRYENLVYLRENAGCEWDWSTPAFAARGGSIRCMEYAYENGCEWDWKTPAFAVLEDQVDCLEYAHKHGCPYNKSVITYATRHKKRCCYRYALEAMFPFLGETGGNAISIYQ